MGGRQGGDAGARCAERAAPPPSRVRYNEWPRVAVPDAGAFTPTEGVTVVVPHFEAPGELALALAALERQRYPRELLEVVVVDDGSRTPPRLAPSGLAVRLVRQEDQGFGAPRARNTGARAARHDILVFLDGDVVVGEGLVAAHARWHHALADAVTVGLRSHVDPGGVDAAAIASAASVAGLFGKATEPPWTERHLVRTDDLTSRHDDLFRAVVSANFGIRRPFFEALGGFDASFTRYGGEDLELGYRAYTAGGLLVPVRAAMAWHLGTWRDGREEKARAMDRQRAKLANLIAHEGFRAPRPGRIWAVPKYVVTVAAEGAPATAVAAAVDSLVCDPAGDGDLVVRIETAGTPEDTVSWLEDAFGGDPRVRVAPERSGLDAYPASPFHVTVPAGACPPALLERLRAGLGTAAVGTAVLGDGATATVTRAWAAHRARRTGGAPGDFGDAVQFALRRRARAGPKRSRGAAKACPDGPHSALGRLAAEARHVRGPRTAWRFTRWVLRGVRWRLSLARPVPRARRLAKERREAGVALGVEIAAHGPRAAAVFAAAGAPAGGRRAHVDVVLADERPPPGAQTPVVVLARSPALLSVPAVDPRRYNPVGWVRNVENGAAALGPRPLLPADAGVRHEVSADELSRLRHSHHLEDIAAFHASARERAATLVRLAAMGVPVHLADGGPGLAERLGAELHALMAAPEMRTADIETRERLSIAMRRVALREHSLASRARQVCAAAGVADVPALAKVSVLLPTRRPALLARALANVARQSYPNLELVLALHGEGFGDVPDLAGLGCPVKVCRVGADAPLGSVLNAATAAATGTLLAKMDDDDLYGADHVWDLVLAREYSGAELVGKGIETVYLAERDRTVRLGLGNGETYHSWHLSGGALLVSRHALERAGGWRRMAGGVDIELVADVHRSGLGVYRLHGADLVVVRHGAHTWRHADEYFLHQADAVLEGFGPAPDMAWARDAMTGVAGTTHRAAPNGGAPEARRAGGSPGVRRPDRGAAWPARQGRIEPRAPSRLHTLAGRARRVLAARREPYRARVLWMRLAVAARAGPPAAWVAALAAAAPTPAHRAVACDVRRALAAGRRAEARAMLATLARVPDRGAEKVVSRRHRYVWIGNPKVASRSLIAGLLDADPAAELFREATLAEVYRARPEARAFTTFAFVRNPYDRAHSFFCDAGPRGGKRGELLAGRHGVRGDASFAELCAWLETPYGSDAFANRHWLSQHETLRLEDGRLPDVVGRYERLEADLADIASRLGMPRPALPALNRSPRAVPADCGSGSSGAVRAIHLNEVNRALLRLRYAADFEQFGYAP